MSLESSNERRAKPVLGFMLLEVLVALAVFGMAAVFLVDGISVASRTMRLMKDTRKWNKICCGHEVKFSRNIDTMNLKRGEIEALTIGEIRWETEIEMTEVLDLFSVTLLLEYDGNDDLGIKPGERTSKILLLRPGWSKKF